VKHGLPALKARSDRACRSLALFQAIGTSHWGMSVERVRIVLEQHRPAVQPSPSTVSVGRVTLLVTAAKVRLSNSVTGNKTVSDFQCDVSHCSNRR
jgi:hypothetical protein